VSLSRSGLFRCLWFLLLGVSVLGRAPDAKEKDAQAENRRVTVADMIEMTRWADRDYFLGGESRGRVGLFSPDRKQFIVAVKKGNVERNTVDYSLLLFRTNSVFQSPKPQVLVKMSSSSNRDAIAHIKWLSDSETVVFLGEKPEETPEVYSINVETKLLKKLTNHSTPVVAYDISDDGEVIVYEAAAKSKVKRRKSGIIITTQNPSDFFRCDCGPDLESEGAGNELFVQRKGWRSSRIPSSDFVTESQTLSVSRTGRYALLSVYVRDVDPSWAEYQDRFLHPLIVEPRRLGTRSNLRRFMLLDSKTLEFTPLLNTPISSSRNGFAWAKDGDSLVLSGAYLPLDVADPAEREARQKRTFVAEIKLPGKEILKITDAELKIAKWDQVTERLLLEPGNARVNSPTQAYEKIGATWKQVRVTEADTRTDNPVDVTLEEDISTPPKIFISDAKSHRRTQFFDLNPAFAQLHFGKVEAVSWKGTDGHEVQGGLYLPPDYTSGTRYPLVIQTHGFRKDRFWIDGPWSSAFAAAALAAKGIVVLQVGGSIESGEDSKYIQSPEEAPRQMAAYEGAIDYLFGRGLIDRNRVGIIGFSRTVFYVEYTLTHSRYQFTAVTLADGFEGGYLNYLLWPSVDYVLVNGGPPNGSSLPSWLKNSPGFNLDKVSAAVRLEYYGPAMFLGGWQWFSGLSLLEKPVDFVWLPDGTHLLVKPSERLASQQGNVDWFSFWLKGEEESDPAKREQYKRWEGLRPLLHREDRN
jgi:dipeptidyl aminopeptidase/acylaminoacyl peptidase